MPLTLRVWITTPSKSDAERVAVILANKGFQVGALAGDNILTSGDDPCVGAYKVTCDKDVTASDLRDLLKTELLGAKVYWYSLIVAGDGGGTAWMAGVTKRSPTEPTSQAPTSRTPSGAGDTRPRHSSHPTPPSAQIRMVYPGHMGLDLDLILMDDTQTPWRTATNFPLVRNYDDFHKLGMKAGVDDTDPVPFQTYTPGEGESTIMTDGYGDIMYVPAKTFQDIRLTGSYMNMNVIEQLRRARPDQPVLLFWH
jgi:hypothetical protein